MSVSSDQPLRQQASSRTKDDEYAGLKKTSVLLMLLFTILTLGFYAPIWFLRRRKVLNRLGGDVGPLPFIFVIILMLVSKFLGFIDDPSSPLGSRLLPSLLGFAGTVIIIIESLRVKRILESSSQIQDADGLTLSAQPERFSWILTFFLTIYYLQFKINRGSPVVLLLVLLLVLLVVVAFVFAPLLSECQQQDTTAQEADSPEAKLRQAMAVAAELPALSRLVKGLEAAVPGDADATPSQSDVDAIVAGYDEEFRFDCSEAVLSAASARENELRRAQCHEMERLRPLLVAVAEYRAKLVLLEKLRDGQ